MSETDHPFGFEFSTHQNVFTLFKWNFFTFYQQWMEQTCFIVYMTYQVHTKGPLPRVKKVKNIKFQKRTIRNILLEHIFHQQN